MVLELNPRDMIHYIKLFSADDELYLFLNIICNLCHIQKRLHTNEMQ